jgi:hypothetical protein
MLQQDASNELSLNCQAQVLPGQVLLEFLQLLFVHCDYAKLMKLKINVNKNMLDLCQGEFILDTVIFQIVSRIDKRQRSIEEAFVIGDFATGKCQKTTFVVASLRTMN